MKRLIAAVLAVLLPGGCVAVTVNVNFQNEIDRAASSIEDAVRTPAAGGPPAPDAVPPVIEPSRHGGRCCRP